MLGSSRSLRRRLSRSMIPVYRPVERAEDRGRVYTYESSSIRCKPANQVFPSSTSFGHKDDPPAKLPCNLNLLTTDTLLVRGKTNCVDVLERYTGIHSQELTNITRDKERKVESALTGCRSRHYKNKAIRIKIRRKLSKYLRISTSDDSARLGTRSKP